MKSSTTTTKMKIDSTKTKSIHGIDDFINAGIDLLYPLPSKGCIDALIESGFCRTQSELGRILDLLIHFIIILPKTIYS